jgi:RHS repeat-associated protein
VQLAYSYDALGRRTSKILQGTATQFLYDGANAMQEMQGSTINPILVGLGIDERFARNDVTGRTYFLTDQLNSTIALTDPTGAIREQYSYDPYGNVTPSDTTTGFTNPYQYTGREADTAGVYYYRARYYSPMMGGFISEDPIGSAGGQPSFYAYVGGDPVSFWDSTGLSATVTVSGNTVNITLPISYVGANGQAVDPQMTAAWNNEIQSDWSGTWDGYTVTTTVVPGGPGVKNSNTITVLPGTGTSTTNGVGGDTGDWYGGDDPWVAAHEAGHLMGLDDHYTAWCDHGVRKSKPNPGWGGDIMGDYNGKVSPADISGIIQAHKHWWQR